MAIPHLPIFSDRLYGNDARINVSLIDIVATEATWPPAYFHFIAHNQTSKTVLLDFTMLTKLEHYEKAHANSQSTQCSRPKEEALLEKLTPQLRLLRDVFALRRKFERGGV